jgi:hypothetical protein
LIWLANLLVVILCAQVFLFPGRDLVTAGLTQYCFAGILVGWASMATVIRRKQRADSENWVLQLMRTARITETLLMAGCIYGASSWLNLLAAKADSRFSTAASVLAAALCTFLFLALARYQDVTTDLSKGGRGTKRVRAAMAWVVLMMVYALPLVGGAAVVTVRKGGRVMAPELTPPELALAWLGFCSLFLGAVLFRPWAMRSLPNAGPPVLFAVLAVLGSTAALEHIWRRDWYLYTLTSLIFLGTALGIWRLADSLSRGSQVKLPTQ